MRAKRASAADSTAISPRSRLIASSASGITFPLPEAHVARLQAFDGVSRVSWANWFGGYYQDPNDYFAQFAVENDNYLDMYPEIQVVDDQKEAYLRERTAALVGVGLMDKYGWQVGQTVTLKGTIFPGDWDFVIRAVYTPSDPSWGDETFFFHYDYLYEATNGAISPCDQQNEKSWRLNVFAITSRVDIQTDIREL